MILKSQFDYHRRAEAARKAQTDFRDYSKNLLHSLREAFQSSDLALYQKLLAEMVELQRSPTYLQLLQEVGSAREAAYPENFWQDYEELRSRQRLSALETAIEFLEADPYFFRSGYTKEKLMRYIRHYELTPGQADRLRQVILNVVDQHYCREFCEYRKLGRKVDSIDFRAALQTRISDGEANIKKRANWVFDYLVK